MSLSLLKIFNYVFNRTPILFIAGIVTVVLGSVKQQPWITRWGTGLFLSGAAVFMGALGGRDLAFKVLEAQTRGFRVEDQTLGSVLSTIFSLALMLLGIGLQCLIIKGYFLGRYSRGRLAGGGAKRYLFSMTDKQAVVDALQRLPENASLEEITEELQIMAAVRRARADVAAGRTKTDQEVKTLLESWEILHVRHGAREAPNL